MSKQQASTRGNEIKRKQMILLAGGAGIFAVVTLGATYMFTKDAPDAKAQAQKATPISLVTAGSAYAEKEAWRTQLGSDVANMQKQFQDFAKQMEERQQKQGEEDKKEASKDPGLTEKVKDLAPPVRPGDSAEAAPTSPPPPLNLPPPPPVRQGAAGSGSPGMQGGPFAPPVGPGGVNPETGAPVSTISSVSFDDAPGDKAADATAKKDKKEGTYLTSGTFARAVLLNGINAPTGGQSQSNPSPVLLRIIEPATLPNGYRVDIKDCVITGNGIGVMEAESARIRLDRMSCIDGKGEAIDIPIRGYVTGDDGSEGVRGKVISKTGQMLANALLASVGSGIGEAFKSASETQTANAFGTTTTVTKPGDGFTKGFGTGTQRAFDMLAKYYITLAEKTFPVVEVRGGRVVDVVFSKGFVVEGR